MNPYIKFCLIYLLMLEWTGHNQFHRAYTVISISLLSHKLIPLKFSLRSKLYSSDCLPHYFLQSQIQLFLCSSPLTLPLAQVIPAYFPSPILSYSSSLLLSSSVKFSNIHLCLPFCTPHLGVASSNKAHHLFFYNYCL